MRVGERASTEVMLTKEITPGELQPQGNALIAVHPSRKFSLHASSYESNTSLSGNVSTEFSKIVNSEATGENRRC